jgi:hypothetical protein
MVLYAADVIDLTPKVDAPVKPKRVRKPKAKKEVEEVKEEPKEEVKEEPKEEVVIETVITQPVEVPKKRKRDTEKAQLARKAKKEEAERMKKELETLKQKLEKPKKRSANPPKWFQSYVENVRKDESTKAGEKKETKEIKTEALEMAKKTWGDGFTRDKVEQEFQSHRNRLYSMIFSK